MFTQSINVVDAETRLQGGGLVAQSDSNPADTTRETEKAIRDTGDPAILQRSPGTRGGGASHIADVLRTIKGHDGLQKYEIMNGKPVITIQAESVINVENDKFADKLMCDQPIFNTSDLCSFQCSFCYVPAAVEKLHKRRLEAFNKETGLNLKLNEVIIRRANPLELVRSALIKPDGSRRYDDPHDERVIYGATLMDVAANMTLLRETAEVCNLILEHTNWQIRLLSKSSLLAKLVTLELIPKKYHHRLILGFSTGTLDDEVAAAIEGKTGSVSRRIQALHDLQDRGIRTFAMICPSLPHADPHAYDDFSRRICEALRVDRCEHVYAEVINLRGDSLKDTIQALRAKNLDHQSDLLQNVSKPGDKTAWEEYARMTYEAHKKFVPKGKLRFLQYISAKSAPYWKAERANGAVVLGKYAVREGLITREASSPTGSQRELSADEVELQRDLEAKVSAGLQASIAAAQALHSIKNYEGGLMWRKQYRTFHEYCGAKWGYQKSHAYRLVQTGGFIEKISARIPHVGESTALTEGLVRSMIQKVPEEQWENCTRKVLDKLDQGGTKRSAASKVIAEFSKNDRSGMRVNAAGKGLPETSKSVMLRDRARHNLRTLERALLKLEEPRRFRPLLDGLEILIGQDPGGLPPIWK